MEFEGEQITRQIDTDGSDEQDEGRKAVMEYFEQNRRFLTAYAQDASFKVEPGGFTDADGNYVGFAINLETRTLYSDPRFFTDRGYSSQKAMVGHLHELEHLRELNELLSEQGGYKIWQRQQSRTKSRPRLHILDNCVADIRENRNIQTRAPAQRSTLSDLYRENLFSERELRSQPLHLQFVYSLLRDRMIPDEQSEVDPKVRVELERLEAIKTSSGSSLLDFITRPDLPPSTRQRLQERFLEPVYERFFQEDVEKRKKEAEKGEPKEGKGKGKKGKPGKPEDYFVDEYKDFDQNRSPRAVPADKIEKAVKEYQKTAGKSDQELIAEAYAREQQVDLQDIKNYQAFWEKIEDLKNPETDERVVEELREIFKKIIAERKKPHRVPRAPVTEGEILFNPIQAYLDFKAGKDESQSWLTFAKKERTKELYGQFDITWVVDRSDSMNDGDGQKRAQQKIGTILGLEAIKEFCDQLDDAKVDIKQDLEVRSEVWSFGSEEQVEMLKPLSEELTERQRVAVYKKLDDCPGSTMDFAALERIRDGLEPADLVKIEQGKLRKIIIVQTDGGSDNAGRLRSVLDNLRGKGIVVVAVGNGIAEGSGDATTVRANYAYPDGTQGAQICPQAEQTPQVLSDLLKVFLSELM